MMAIGKNKTRLNQRNLLLLTSLSLFMSLSLCLKGQPLPQTSRQAKNVIYLIGDGMSLPQIYGAMLATGRDLSFKQFPYCGIVTPVRQATKSQIQRLRERHCLAAKRPKTA